MPVNSCPSQDGAIWTLLMLACLQITQQRSLHELPQLKAHGHVFREKGIPPFLSPEAYTLAWFDYQSMLIEKLNQLTFGTVLDPVHIVHCTANKILVPQAPSMMALARAISCTSTPMTPLMQLSLTTPRWPVIITSSSSAYIPRARNHPLASCPMSKNRSPPSRL